MVLNTRRNVLSEENYFACNNFSRKRIVASVNTHFSDNIQPNADIFTGGKVTGKIVIKIKFCTLAFSLCREGSADEIFSGEIRVVSSSGF